MRNLKIYETFKKQRYCDTVSYKENNYFFGETPGIEILDGNGFLIYCYIGMYYFKIITEE